MINTRGPAELWRAVSTLPDFRRLVELRAASQFGDGLFQAGLAGALLFNPDRAATPWAVAGAFAVLFLPYSLLGPFAGALLDRWDRRQVLLVANFTRLLLVVGISILLDIGADDVLVLWVALVATALSRFIGSGLSAALPHLVLRPQVVTMNALSIAAGAVAAFVGANVMLVVRWLAGSDDHGAASVILVVTAPVVIALVLTLRFAPDVLGPDPTARDTRQSVFSAVLSGWLHGARTVRAEPIVAATLSGLVAHRMVFGINTLLVLTLVRHVEEQKVAGLGTTVLFVAATGAGAFVATVLTPAVVRHSGRYATANGALAVAAVIEFCALGLALPVLVACGFLLGMAGQVVKLCADTAMQVDVDDAHRGHVFTVQDSLFWVAFIAAVTAAAAIVAPNGQSPSLVLTGAVIYVAGLVAHAMLGRRWAGIRPPNHTDIRRRSPDRDSNRPNAQPGRECTVVDARAIIADLRAESDELDELIAPLSAQQWATPTPAPGWTVAHQIAHLLWTDRLSLSAIDGGEAFQETLKTAMTDPDFVDAGAAQLAALPPARLLADWRATRERLHTALGEVSDGTELPWFGPPMCVASMATARLMETWAHGLDIADTLAVTRPATARLRSVAHLGVRVRDYSFGVNNLPAPSEPFRVELRGSDGDLWTWGPPDAAQRVTGSAEDFCFLVTRRRPLRDLDVQAEGADAMQWLRIAQAFAGPPGVGR